MQDAGEVLIRDQQDIAALPDVTSCFSAVSAAKVNWSKSEALAVGKSSQTEVEMGCTQVPSHLLRE